MTANSLEVQLLHRSDKDFGFGKALFWVELGVSFKVVMNHLNLVSVTILNVSVAKEDGEVKVGAQVISDLAISKSVHKNGIAELREALDYPACETIVALQKPGLLGVDRAIERLRTPMQKSVFALIVGHKSARPSLEAFQRFRTHSTPTLGPSAYDPCDDLNEGVIFGFKRRLRPCGVFVEDSPDSPFFALAIHDVAGGSFVGVA